MKDPKEVKFRAKDDGVVGGYLYTHKEVLWKGATHNSDTASLVLGSSGFGVSHQNSDYDWYPIENVEIFCDGKWQKIKLPK